MRTDGVVSAEVTSQRRTRFSPVRVCTQVHLLVLHAPPFCAAPQNGGYVPRVVTWPTVRDAVDLPSVLGG
jgi:hypothetical protein